MRIAIVGGGLAGLSCAKHLAERGYPSTIYEARPRLGGRASSFVDPATGELVDTCQHVSMGCCTEFHAFCSDIGLRSVLEPQPTLWFLTPDGRESRFRSDPWPAPLHLSRALLGAHYLTSIEKLRIVYGLARLIAMKPAADLPLEPWLRRHGQTTRTNDRFWNVVLVSALNETIDRIGLKYARKVFVDGFLKDRDGFTVHVPTVSLGELYGDGLRSWLAARGVAIRENAAAKGIDGELRLNLRSGESTKADTIVAAVPFERLDDLLPPEWSARPEFANIRQLEPSPITSLHLWTDRPILDRPHAVLLESLGHWVFLRDSTRLGEHYGQIVLSATRALRGMDRGELTAKLLDDLRRMLPGLRGGRVLRTKLITEKSATFSAVPGVDELRPRQRTSIPGFYLAGDYTQTGWPATMEGAVRSGRLAAEAIIADQGSSRSRN